MQQAEKAYAQSIEKLSAVAAKDLEQSSSPVAAAYREKLALLDSANRGVEGRGGAEPLQHVFADGTGFAVPGKAEDSTGMVTAMRIGTSLILLFCALRGCARRAKSTSAIFRRPRRCPPGRTLRVEHSLGSVNVRTQAKDEVAVAAAIRCSADTWQADAQLLRPDQIRVEEGALRSHHPHRISRNETGRGNNLGYSANLEIAMPETAPLELRNRFGNVTVQKLHAPAVINNSNGNVVVAGGQRTAARGERLRQYRSRCPTKAMYVVNGQNGWLRATDINGAAEISNRFGEVRATNIARDLTVRGNNMQVEAERVGGVADDHQHASATCACWTRNANVTVHNQNGKVDGERGRGIGGSGRRRSRRSGSRASARGDGAWRRIRPSPAIRWARTRVVETTFANVDLRGVKGGARVTAQNSAIRLADIGGEVYAKTTFAATTVEERGRTDHGGERNGSVTVTAKPGAGMQADRDSAPPSRRFASRCPPASGYTVTGRTSFGRIQSEQEMTRERRDRGRFDQRQDRRRRLRNAPHRPERQHRHREAPVGQASRPVHCERRLRTSSDMLG